MDRVTASGAVGRAFESPKARQISYCKLYPAFPPNPFSKLYVVISGGFVLWYLFPVVAIGALLFMKRAADLGGGGSFFVLVSHYTTEYGKIGARREVSA